MSFFPLFKRCVRNYIAFSDQCAVKDRIRMLEEEGESPFSGVTESHIRAFLSI